MNFFDAEELLNLLLKFGFNFIIITILVRGIYFKFSPNKEFAFTFLLFNVLIFLACFFMSSMDIGMGFAFGLFAIFGLLRYRTITVPIKEMTYLLSVIVIAVLNSIPMVNFSVVTIMVSNLLILGLTFIMEIYWFSDVDEYKMVYYENIDLIEPGKENELLADLKARTGLNVSRFEIEEFNFLRDSTLIKLYYTPKLR